jgi:tetrapyrrole methylase family protein / MazG family protein
MPSEIEDFLKTIEALRDPKTGCPWNKAQTHGSLKRYLIEELYECLEVIDAIDELENDPEKHFKISKSSKSIEKYFEEFKEELGDLLLQILLHSQIAAEKGYFTFQDVAKTCNEKMIKRHPHVFKELNEKVNCPEEVDKHWEFAKKQEKSERKSIFEGIPLEMPALARAWKISKKAVRESFEWDREDQLWAQLESEIAEFKELNPITEKEKAELELGDILFTVVNIARWFKIDPEDALRKTNNKFIGRFNLMIDIATSESKSLTDFDSFGLEELWKRAKEKQTLIAQGQA